MSGLPNTGLVGAKVRPFFHQQLLQLRHLHPSNQLHAVKESVSRDKNEQIVLRMSKLN
jgi:hypothetical protein